MNICSSLIRRSIVKMMNMTFPLSYIFFMSVMEEEEILLVSIFRNVYLQYACLPV